MTLRDSPSFDKQGYWPNTPSQWREPTVDDCTWYAGEFAFQAADVKHRNYHPVNDIRLKSADNTGGTTVAYMMQFTEQFWPDDSLMTAYYGSFGAGEIRDRLSKGATFVVGGDYEQLPLHYRRWTNNDEFNHAVAIRFYDEGTDRTAMYDPLGGGPTYREYDGEWISLEALLKGYWWRGGKGWVAGITAPYREERIMKPFVGIDGAELELRVKERTYVYNGPSAGSAIERRIWKDTNWWPTIGRAVGGWFLILWTDSETKDLRWGYVHREDIVEKRNIERTEPTGEVDPDLVAQIENLQLEVDRLKNVSVALQQVSEERLAVINTVRDVVRAK